MICFYMFFSIFNFIGIPEPIKIQSSYEILEEKSRISHILIAIFNRPIESLREKACRTVCVDRAYKANVLGTFLHKSYKLK